MLAGGWSPFGPLSEEDKAVFDEATAGILGVKYEALVVSTQVVAGENYRFFCNATLVTAEPITTGKMVQVFRSLDGKAGITSITDV